MWFVYILKCSDNKLYTGITKDIDRRIVEHNSTRKGAKYTRSRRPVELLIFCNVKNKSDALKLEYKIKSLKKEEKINYLQRKKNEMENCSYI
jgi:putative endonuclease